MDHQVMGFIDGVNLVLRYQDMRNNGSRPTSGVTHIEDLLIWHQRITDINYCDVVRMSYYQTAVGDEQKLNAARQSISEVSYPYSTGKKGDLGDKQLRARSTKTRFCFQASTRTALA